MLTLEQCRRADPKLRGIPDEMLIELRDRLYGLVQLAFEKHARGAGVSKNPIRVSPHRPDGGTV